jgi:hypothetical protein
VDNNHPDQYYTITKEKGKKMPRFNTQSNEYRVTFNELNVQSVLDILKTLQNLFDSVLTDVTKGTQEEDLVQVTLECPDLDFPIRLPFMQMNQLTSELLLSEIERVLQSNEQFVLDHCVQLNISHVSLPKGGTGKRCDYVDTERFLKDKRCTWTKSSSCIPLVTSVKTEPNRFCRVFNMSGTLWTFNSLNVTL